MLANGVKETTTTTGTGTVTLSAVTGFPRFSQVLSVGQYVDYAIQDGSNWEWGVGKVAASNTLERTLATAKFDGGTYSKNPATPLSLSGSATVFCAITDATQGTVSAEGPFNGSAVSNALHIQTTAYLQNTTFSNANKLHFYPWSWPNGVDRFAKGVRVRVNGVSTSTKLRVGVVQYGATQSDNKLLAQTSDIPTTSTGVKPALFAAPIAMPYARYALVMIRDGNATLTRAEGFIPDTAQLSSSNPFGRLALTYSSFDGWTEITPEMVTSACDGGDIPEQPLIQLLQ